MCLFNYLLVLAAYNYFNLGETSSSDDDDNEYNPEEWKKV